MTTENQTPIETPKVTKVDRQQMVDLQQIREELGLGAALDVGIHAALDAAMKKDTRDTTN